MESPLARRTSTNGKASVMSRATKQQHVSFILRHCKHQRYLHGHTSEFVCYPASPADSTSSSRFECPDLYFRVVKGKHYTQTSQDFDPHKGEVLMQVLDVPSPAPSVREWTVSSAQQFRQPFLKLTSIRLVQERMTRVSVL